MERPADNNMDTTDDFVKSPLPVLFRYVVYIFAGTGFVCNLFVIVVNLRHTKLWRQLTCKYIVNQSIIDALTLVVFVVRIQTVPDDSTLLASLGGLQAHVYYRLWSSPFLLYFCFRQPTTWSPSPSSGTSASSDRSGTRCPSLT